MERYDLRGTILAALKTSNRKLNLHAKVPSFCCPRHDDTTASAWIGDHAWGCHACGFTEELDTLADTLGLERPTSQRGLTLIEYAERKGFTVDSLQKWGVHDGTGRFGDPVVVIPYRDAEGNPVRERHRTRKGVYWGPGTGTSLYGLDILAQRPPDEPVLIVEGESDCHAAWHKGILAVGIPGATAWRSEWHRHLGTRPVYIWQEPDPAGTKMVATIAADIPHARVIIAGPDDPKDLADLFKAMGKEFKAAVRTYMTTAIPAKDLEDQSITRLPDPDSVRPRLLRVLLENPALLQPPPALIPGMVLQARTSLLVAREKCGKSTLMGQGAAALSRGRTFLGHHLEPVTVLWYALDEPLHDAVRRLAGYQADPDRFYLIDRRPDSPDALADDIRECGAAFVVIDTLGKLWLSRVDENRADEVEAFLTPYIEAVRGAGAALGLLHHAGKGTGTYRGSTAIGACVDVILTLKRRQGRKTNTGALDRTTDESEREDEESLDDGRRILEGAGRGIASYALRLSFDGESYKVGDDTLPLTSQICALLQVARLNTTQIREALKNAGQGRRNEVVTDALRDLESQQRLALDGEGLWYLRPSVLSGLGISPEPSGNETLTTHRDDGTSGNGSGTGAELLGNETGTDRPSSFPIRQDNPLELGTERERATALARLSDEARNIVDPMAGG